MASIFRKLISKEFGKNNYDKYFYCYQKLIANKTYDHRKLDNEEIFNDMYEYLKDKDIIFLTKMLDRLADTMNLALRISKTYIFTLVCYILASLFIVSQGLVLIATLTSIILMSVCFIYKTYEYVVNKYCFIDAHIIIIYKSVLDKLILRYDNGKDRSQ